MPKHIPTRKDWQAMKKKYGVADGAVRGINVGEELDKYNAATNLKERQVAVARLEQKLAAYIGKVDKKSVKQFPAFQKDFLDNYVGVAHFFGEDLKRYAADAETYKKELVKFFGAVQKLNKDTSTKADLEAFKSGPMRGLSALGSNARKVDPREIDAALAPVNKAIDKLPDNPSPEALSRLVAGILQQAKAVQVAAKKQQLV